MKKKTGKILNEVFVEWKWLSRFMKKYVFEILLQIFIGVFGTLMGLGTSVATKFLIDAVVSHSSDTIVLAASVAVGLAVSQVIITAVTSRISSRVGTKINAEMRSGFFENLTSAYWEEISSFHSGELINRLEGDINTVSSGIISFLPSVFTRGIQFLGAFGIVMYYDPTMAVLALLGSPVVFLTSKFMMRKIREYNKESRRMNGRIISYGEETLQNLQTVKAFGLAGAHAESFRKLISEYRDLKLKHDKVSVLMTMSLSLVGLAVSYACYGWGVWRLWSGDISYGTMTMFIQLSGILTSAFSSIVSLAPSAVSIATSAGRIKELSELPKETDDDKQSVDEMLEASKKDSLKISGKDITFSYKGSEQAVLSNADFCMQSGETVAFIGPSGEGKTTALRLILGLIRPFEGKVEFSCGGETVSASCSTRRLCSYVPQGNDVVSGSVAENLLAVNPEASDKDIEEALKTADAWDFVSALPDGIKSDVGEHGSNFSEGQAQRIAIARAVLRKAPVLLMDEATSALDSETEKRVLHNLMKSNPERICIITTHRPSMLEYCTKIYRINEDGTIDIIKNGETEKV